ncbi:hypothetical protein GYB57_12270 [bacterium]|nr:hypothetical protein [bacterium]
MSIDSIARQIATVDREINTVEKSIQTIDGNISRKSKDAHNLLTKISTDKFDSNYWLIGYSTKNRFWYDLIKW